MSYFADLAKQLSNIPDSFWPSLAPRFLDESRKTSNLGTTIGCGGVLYGAVVGDIYLQLKKPGRAFFLAGLPAVIAITAGHDLYKIGGNLTEFYLTKKIGSGPIDEKTFDGIVLRGTISQYFSKR